jgi:predicted N-acetyltransferase YhbS
MAVRRHAGARSAHGAGIATASAGALGHTLIRMLSDPRSLAPARKPIPGLKIRALEPADLAAAAALSAAAFGLDIREQPAAQRWRDRVAHSLATDPEGSFVAERGGSVVAVAQALRRERLWCLSLLKVQPGVQSSGAGRLLLDRALSYASDTSAGLIISSSDPRALRLYALAGFSLQPTFEASGAIDRSAFPAPDDALHEGGAADLEALAAISREIRGAPHTPELEFALGRGAQLVRLGDRGFAVTSPGHGVWLLVARDEEAATALLWRALSLVGEADRPTVRWITAGQDWAIEVVLRAGLRLAPSGALCVRGQPGPLRPFLPSAPFA